MLTVMSVQYMFSFCAVVAVTDGDSYTPTRSTATARRTHTSFFIAKNTLVFTLIVQRVFSFSSTAFSFPFSP
jgi:hypothetical protein